MKDAPHLPACESDSPPVPSQAEPPQRILVVEDDSSLRQLNTQVLIHFNYHVDAAEDGAAAWEAPNADGYDLLITDNNMPKVSGVELLKKLRAARKAVPVVMAAGRLPTHALAQDASLQLAATLSKPFPVDALLATVHNVLRATEGTREQFGPPPTRGYSP